ncbi:MAG: ABC transporter permease subunit [Planctomycetia bacterium]|nr:ABC transporter permease subunit [Planctomycetia bacterium]
MSLHNVKLIFGRELRDQLRDRRTLFMIAVLPLLFYPLLGFTFFQIAQFLQDEPSKILIVGCVDIPGLPAFNKEYVDQHLGEKKRRSRFELDYQPLISGPDQKLTSPYSKEQMQRMVKDGKYQAVLSFSPHFAEKVEEYRVALRARASGTWPNGKPMPQIPEPEIICDSHQEKSAVTGVRTGNVLESWTEDVGRKTLAETNVPANAAKPIEIRHEFLGAADEQRFDSSLWSKVLPFVLLIWAVTGAFYPAVDLCAGEKERGTLETLLSSPAHRSEIVFGKLLTVMLFSVVTAVLNLVSMGITGSVVMKSLGDLPQAANVGPPPLASLGWLILMLLPVSALFSAICLALAAFARSTKEGQYYLMPVILVTMPLILLPMAPSAELNLGNSLVPVSGIVLLMRSMMEGTIGRLWPYAIPVSVVTFVCCWAAIRWAIDQFSSESVLFREGERWDLTNWFAHLLRDRQPTPSVAMAVLCGAVILVIRFFVGFMFTLPSTFNEFFQQSLITQIAVVATPALIMAVMLTLSPARTLLLSMPMNRRSFASLLVAAALAIALHPAVMSMEVVISWLYPVSAEVKMIGERVVHVINDAPNAFMAVLAIAILPAFCEELAFRGFILSGFRHMGRKWRAIGLSALLFGFSHGILQQSIMASLIGCVLGFIAIQAGSLWPGVVFHLVHNCLGYVVGFKYNGDLSTTQYGWLQIVLKDNVRVYHPAVVMITLATAVIFLLWFRQLSYRRTSEESLQEAIEQEAPIHSLAR